MRIKREDIIEEFLEGLENIVDSILISFEDIFKKNNILKKNAENIYRWNVYYSYSNIIGKLINIYNEEILKPNTTNNNFNYNKKFNTTIESTQFYYYNNNFNTNLSENLEKIINKNIKYTKLDFNKKFDYNFIYKNKKKNYLKIFFLKIKNKLKTIYYRVILNNKKEVQIYEYSNFLKINKSNVVNIVQKNNTEHNLDLNIRKQIRNEIVKNFKHDFIKKVFKLNQNQTEEIIIIIAKVVEFSLPLSIVENLNNKLQYYNNYLIDYNITQIHSVIGQFFDDNFKIFCSTKKNKKTKIIVHEHGITNFSKIFTDTNKDIFIKNYVSMKFANLYFAWGKSKLSDRWDGVEKKYNIKIINKGSNYLRKIKKFKKLKFNRHIKILYIGGPNKIFFNSLDEVSPYENYLHKIEMAEFIKELIFKYENIEIVYKKFDPSSQDYSNDIMFNLLYDEIKKNKIKITYSKPLDIYFKFNLVLLDMISTPVAELMNAKMPFIIFANKHEYKMASQDGKKINDQFETNKILAYEKKYTHLNFQFYLKNKFNFDKNQNIFLDFKRLLCYPSSEKNINLVLDK